MAIGWLAVLKSVPWTEVINNAPKVTDGAKKLWNAVAGKPSLAETSNWPEKPVASVDSESFIILEARITTLEAAISDLHDQMLASTELIKALADQNVQLIQRIETTRVRVLWLSAAIALVAMSTMLGLVLIFRQYHA